MYTQLTRRLAVAALTAMAGMTAMAADEALPKADTILEKFIEVTGGRAAREKLRTEVSTGSIEFVGKGIKGTLTTYKEVPDKMLLVMDIPGIGKIEEGYDGQVAWGRNAMQGPRIKEGDEKALAVRGASFNAELKWHDFYKSADTKGVEEVDGKPCYKIIMTPIQGNPETRFYDKQSSLLVKSSMVVKTQMGEIAAETDVADYRKEGDFLMPHKVTQKVAGQELLMTLDTVKYNGEIEKGRFDLPDEIKALVKK